MKARFKQGFTNDVIPAKAGIRQAVFPDARRLSSAAQSRGHDIEEV